MDKNLRYALLCGSAPEGKIQKKIDSMYESLRQENGGMFKDNEIMIFPNGTDETLIAYTLDRLFLEGTEQVFIYVCTESPVLDYEKAVWLGGNEINKSVFEEPKPFSVQVVYDSDRDFIDSDEYYFDEQSAGELWRMA